MRLDGTYNEQVASAASLRKPLAIGSLALLAAFGGLSSWSLLAPIASAAIAPGAVIVDGSRKTIQHPDGGIIKQILVREGDLIEEGQTLLMLDGVRLDNTVQTLRPLLAIKLAQRARLLAEREASPTLEMPTETVGGVNLEMFPQIVADQRKLLEARRESLEARIAATVGEGEQAVEAGKGLRYQIITQTRRVNLTQAELQTAQELARTGAGTLRRVLEISRVLADLEGDLAGLSARAAEADRRVDSAALEGRRARATFLEGVENELGENGREQLEIMERLSNATEQSRRLHILAPVTGQVVNLSVHTVGAVVVPAAPLLEIVPASSPLIIEAQVRTSDIGRVEVGLPVEIRIIGVDNGKLSRLMGTVTLVSADRLTDRNKGSPFFGVRVEVDSETRRNLGKFQLKAGMGVNVLILQEERTVLEYLLDPILSFFSEAMRE